MRTILIALMFTAEAVNCTPATAPNPQPTVDAAPAPLLDGGALHSYTCPVGEAGAMFTCQDGLTTVVGTCANMGCVPVQAAAK